MPALPLYNEFDEWNRAAQAQRETFYAVRDEAANWLFRTLLYDLKPHCFVLMAFIFDRTFRWSKYAEAISHDHFLHGIEDIDEDGNAQVRRSANGQPLCGGVGFRNSKSTLTKHLKEIVTLGHVMELSAKRRTGRSVKSYMFNMHRLSTWIVEANGSLPLGAPLVRFAPALLDELPVRIVGRRPLAVVEGDEEAAEHFEYEVLLETRETVWVAIEHLEAIQPEDWAEIKKLNRWLRTVPR